MKFNQYALAFLAVVFLFSCDSLFTQENQRSNRTPQSQTPQKESATWPRPDMESLRKNVEKLLADNSISPTAATEFDWSTRKNIHGRLIQLLTRIPEVNRELIRIRNSDPGLSTENTYDIKSTKMLDANVQLEIAMILVKQEHHDVALALIDQIDSKQLVSPELAILFRVICLHKLVKVNDALKACGVLMAHREKLPIRYQQLTENLYNDLSKQKEEPLHSVARLMSDAKRRQGLQQQTEQVLEQERTIVRKLDEIIKNLEKQKKQSLASAQSKSSPSPSEPDSGPSKSSPSSAGVKGKGDVSSKDQNTDGNWGNLSAEQRAIAVKSLVRELPPHFRSLMKAYFQKLAEETK